jgi:peptidyl-prolyl cis-trans isomerase B (cyclophilin B)
MPRLGLRAPRPPGAVWTGREPGVPSSNKRERELARAKFERQQQRRLEREAARRKRARLTGVVAGLVVVALVVVGIVLASRNSTDTSASASSSPSASGSWNGTPTVKGCTTAPQPTTKTATWKAPTGTLPAGKTYELTLDTNCGKVVIHMDAKNAPKTSQAIGFLAQQGYYTDADCPRLTTSGIFVFQCGSPTNDGQGGPGFTIKDENLPTSKGNNGYTAGTVAMANSGANTNGSQFFIVYKDGSNLAPSYTIWGKVVSGLDMLQRVAAPGVQGGGTDGKPVQPLVITKATTRVVAQAG